MSRNAPYRFVPRPSKAYHTLPILAFPPAPTTGKAATDAGVDPVVAAAAGCPAAVCPAGCPTADDGAGDTAAAAAAVFAVFAAAAAAGLGMDGDSCVALATTDPDAALASLSFACGVNFILIRSCTFSGPFSRLSVKCPRHGPLAGGAGVGAESAAGEDTVGSSAGGGGCCCCCCSCWCTTTASALFTGEYFSILTCMLYPRFVGDREHAPMIADSSATGAVVAVAERESGGDRGR